MKKLAFIIFLLSSHLLFSQVTISKDFTYTVSDPYKVVDGSKYYFSKNNEILAIKYGKGVFTFQKFSGSRMNEVKRVEVNKTTGFSVESYTEINGKFYFFYSVWDKENTTEQLFVREIDFDGCKFVDEGRRIVKVKGKVTGGFTFFGYGGGKFDILKSYDESKVIVQYRKYPESKNDRVNKDVIGMHVFDSDINELWSIDAKMPYTEQKMNNLSYAVDSEGNAFIITEVYRDDSRKRRTKTGEPNYDLELIKVSSDDQSVSNSAIKLKDKFTEAVRFFEGKNGELVLAGFYGNSGKELGVDGFFLSKIQNGDVADIQFYEVPIDVMKMYLSDRAQNKLDKQDTKKDLKLHNMVLREITYDSKGEITIYAEKYYVVVRTDSKGNTTYTYYYQEIVGAGIGADGELKWMNKFPKNQVGKSSRGGMGYYLLATENADYLLFLDNVKNIELPLNKFPAAHSDGKGGFLTGFKVDRETGEAEKVSLFDTRDAKGTALYQFNTGRIIKVNEKTFSVECYKKKKEDVMVTVYLD